VEIDGKHYCAEILDTAGTEAFGAMRDLYYKDAEGFILVYSLSARSTFQDVQDMRDAIVRVKDSEKFSSVLVANKCDLPQEEWAVSHDEGAALAAKWPGCTYIEASAKNDVNVGESFVSCMQKIIISRGGSALGAPAKKAARSKGCTLF
jgi:small GTP-binding protein